MPTNMPDQEKSAMASAASKGMGEGAKSSAKPASSATEAMGSGHAASESQASTLQKTAADKNEAAMKRLAAGVPSMKKGGLVSKTGLYKLHQNEIVLPSPDVLTGKAPKTAPGAKKTKVVNVKKGKKLSTGDTGQSSFRDERGFLQGSEDGQGDRQDRRSQAEDAGCYRPE